MKTYFEKPTQVRFIDMDTDMRWVGGIAYHDEIICGCCGGVIKIDTVLAAATELVPEPILEYDYWVNLSEEITGD